MTRTAITYGERSAPTRTFNGFDPDAPVPGFYRMSLVSGGLKVGIRIWNGPPHDPVTGEELDRSWRMQATANGAAIDMARVWPKCAGDPISEAEHRRLSDLGRWAGDHAPSVADPRKRVDPNTSPMLF